MRRRSTTLTMAFIKEPYTRCDRFYKLFLAADLYTEPFKFLLPGEEDRYRTFLGSMLSLVTICILVGYGTFKTLDLLNYEDYQVQPRLKENFYDTDETLNSSEYRFAVAAAITSYDGKPDIVEDPEIGEIKFFMKKWDVYDPSVEFGFTELETRPCEMSDFNMDGNKDTEA